MEMNEMAVDADEEPSSVSAEENSMICWSNIRTVSVPSAMKTPFHDCPPFFKLTNGAGALIGGIGDPGGEVAVRIDPIVLLSFLLFRIRRRTH
jgi:hypothetical protein